MEMETMKNKEPTLISTTPLLLKYTSNQNMQVEADANCFKQSLTELKDLRSQLFHAADYCEDIFLKTAHKKILLENTKNYLCEAIVTLVDHLGTVSSTLEQQVEGKIILSQTEQRIDCLKQRLLTYQQLDLSLNLSTLQWSSKFPRHHQHYVSTSVKYFQEPNAALRVDTTTDSHVEIIPYKKDQLTVSACDSIFDANVIIKPSITYLTSGKKAGDNGTNEKGTEHATTVPDCEGLSPFYPSFVWQKKESSKLGGNAWKKKLLQEINFLSSIRMGKKRT